MESGLRSPIWVGPIGEAAPWYILVGPVGEASVFMVKRVGLGRYRWVEVVDLRFRD